MAADYYSLIARAVSGLPNNTEEARRAIYDRARAALRERLDTHVPLISEGKFAHEHFALEAAINKVEEDLLFSVMHRFVRETPTLSVTSVVKEFARSTANKLNHTIRDRLRSSETIKVVPKRLEESMVFVQRTQVQTKNIGRRIYVNIFGDKR